MAGVGQLVRFVGTKNKSVAGHDFSRATPVTNRSLAGNDQIKLPLRRVRVVREIALPGRHAVPFQIEWMSLGQIERSRFAPECFRNSLERYGVFPAERLPRFLFYLV